MSIVQDPYAVQILVPLLRDVPDFSVLDLPGSWEDIQRAAEASRTAALVAFAVRKQVTSEQRQWCDQILADAWRRHDENIRGLDHVLGILQDGNVDVLALKGPILGRRYYPVPFLRRPSCDIDLAIRDKDLERGAAVLSRQGYSQQGSFLEARRTSHHLVLNHSFHPRVELHTKLSHGPRGVPVDNFFNSPPVQHRLPTGRTVQVPASADELLALLLHFGNDRYSSFSHLYELRRIWFLASPPVREDVIRRAVEHRFAAVLWLTDLACRSTWGEPLFPADSEIPHTWLQHRFTPELLRSFRRIVVPRGERTLRGRLTGRWLDLQTTDSPADAFRMLLLVAKVASRELPGFLGNG